MDTGKGRRGFGLEVGVEVEWVRQWVPGGEGWSCGRKRRGGGGGGGRETARLLILRGRRPASSDGRADGGGWLVDKSQEYPAVPDSL